MGQSSGVRMQVMKDPNTGEMCTDESKIGEIMLKTCKKMFMKNQVLKHLTNDDIGIIHRLLRYCWKLRSSFCIP